jgi:hypothetical protein
MSKKVNMENYRGFTVFKNISKLCKQNKIGFIGITLTIAFGVLATYFALYTPQPEITYTILSDSNVVNLDKPIEDLKILIKNEDIQMKNMNLKIYTLRISNSGAKDILETHYASSENWGIKISDGKIIESRLIESNSDYIKRNLNPEILNDKTNIFNKVFFDKHDYFILELLILHPKDVNIDLLPFGKISGITKNQSFKKLEETGGGILKNILNSLAQAATLFFLLFIFFGFITLLIFRKARKITKSAVELSENTLERTKSLSIIIKKHINQSDETTLILTELCKNEDVQKALRKNPDLLKKIIDCFSKPKLSVNEDEYNLKDQKKDK